MAGPGGGDEALWSGNAGEALALRQREVDHNIENMDAFLQEMLKRRDVVRGIPSRKRKAPGHGRDPEITVLGPSMTRHLRHRLLSQSGYHSSSSSDSSGSDTSSDSSSSPPESNFSLDSTYQDDWTESPPVIDLNFWPECVPHLSRLSPDLMKEISIPMSGWNPSTMTLTPPRPPNLDSPSNRALLHIFLTFSANNMADCSPTYIDLYRRYIPAMAHESPGLMECLLALAALQMGLRRNDKNLINVEAPYHYHMALKHHYTAVGDPQSLKKDWLLATSIVLAHYEIWNGENIKMGVHMLGGRDIILARGKSAHLSPVGRALYAAFKRIDIITSWISGNPTFMTHDWWTVDPYTRVPIAHDAPILLAADIALSKLCVICCKLTYLKAWAIKRRRDLFLKGAPTGDQKDQLQGRIDRRVNKLEEDLMHWRDDLPEWFDALPDYPATGRDGQEEDINATRIVSILPRRYPHNAIATVHAWAIGVAVQLYRIRYPDDLMVSAKIGGLCHAMLRILAFLPPSCDGAVIAPLFAVGMELRQRAHQAWLSMALKARADETSFHGTIYLRDGLRFAWMKFEGASSGRFNRIKEGAASKIEGVSENLWAAEGMLGTFERLSLYDSPDMVGKRNNFTGDVDMTTLDEDIPLEVALARQREAAGPSDPKRQKSGSPEVVVIDDDKG